MAIPKSISVSGVLDDRSGAGALSIPAPVSAELEAVIGNNASRIAARLCGRFIAVCIMGAAARGESTFDPDGQLIGDLDFLVVLDDRFLPGAPIAEKQARTLLRKDKGFAEFVSIGFSHNIPRYWAIASPMMYEFRAARVLAGDDRVLTWPAVEKPAQIPVWEGIRLVANRMCELTEGLSRFPAWEDFTITGRAKWELLYLCIKLGTACGDCLILAEGNYVPSYRGRLEMLAGLSTPLDNPDRALLESAYRAKLNLDGDLFGADPRHLVVRMFSLALTVLRTVGVPNGEALRRRAGRESPATPGILSDWAFAIKEVVHGRKTALRRAMGSVYAMAWQLADRITRNDGQGFTEECRVIGRAYRRTPQIAALLQAGGWKLPL